VIEIGTRYTIKVVTVAMSKTNDGRWKKIILTTDPNLIAEGVQAIDDEFLLWFVKNSSCEFVVIDWSPLSKNLYGWKIIIPQEEPKPESLVEAAEKWVFETNSHKWSNNDNTAGDNFGSFIAGAKSDAARDYWFQQFKKL
jgi:hypothetical protein